MDIDRYRYRYRLILIPIYIYMVASPVGGPMSVATTELTLSTERSRTASADPDKSASHSLMSPPEAADVVGCSMGLVQPNYRVCGYRRREVAR